MPKAASDKSETITKVPLACADEAAAVEFLESLRNLSTTMGHSTGLIREQCPVW